ncbi:MAG: hypothetical protein GDA44_11515 [Prochloron sp. SP5CPC1]|nr:hypothetical protein [Candidatus Paraprochloron terpiosi SP5CPC1]
MTFSEDFTDFKGEELEEGYNYPTAFGITFTPVVSGITFAIIGLLGGLYIFMNMVIPAQENYKKFKTTKEQRGSQVKPLESIRLDEEKVRLEREVQEEQSLKPQILGVFADGSQNSDTLLIDLNGFIEGRRAKLLSFTPEGEEEVITDGSLGTEVNGKLKRSTYKLEIDGTFEQTQSILRNIERLQSLLMVKDFDSKVTEKPTLLFDGEKVISQGENKLTTKFTVEAILPLD